MELLLECISFSFFFLFLERKSERPINSWMYGSLVRMLVSWNKCQIWICSLKGYLLKFMGEII